MICSELMSRDLRWVTESTSIQDAAVLMNREGVGMLPVCAPDGQVVGVITDRDMALRVCAANRSASETQTGDVMSAPVVTCRPDEALAQAERLMATTGKARVVVVDDQRRPLGILSLADVITRDREGKRAIVTARKVLAREAPRASNPLEHVVESGPAHSELTEEAAPDAEETRHGSPTAFNRESFIVGGQNTRDMKEFPR